MNNRITNKIETTMGELDKIADTYGVARATHIALLANHLLELNGMVAGLMEELEELRKFKEEHAENDDKRNEVPAES